MCALAYLMSSHPSESLAFLFAGNTNAHATNIAFSVRDSRRVPVPVDLGKGQDGVQGLCMNCYAFCLTPFC